ncbi:MAG: hypothetical protein MK538_06860 [Planctomycetes bacterium]|nr:hypothetical protein [Planctomycetota bacterium]
MTVPLCGPLRGDAPREASSSVESSTEPRIHSCILIFYYGGTRHLNTLDMKPDAPSEIHEPVDRPWAIVDGEPTLDLFA